jgi:hypothetical protein
MATETKQKLEMRHLMLTLRGLAGMLRDTLREDEEASTPSELLPWLGGELERLAGEAYALTEADAATGQPDPSTHVWCETPWCPLNPGHTGPCQ